MRRGGGRDTTRWLLVLAALSLTACLPLGTYKVPSSRRPVQEHDLRSLEENRANRGDVILALGAPSFSLEDGRFFIYTWLLNSHMAVASHYGGGFENISIHDLLLEFDEDGCLRRTGELKTLLKAGLGRDHEVDLVYPAVFELSDSGISLSSGAEGLMTFSRESLHLEMSESGSMSYEVPPGGMRKMNYSRVREGIASPVWRPYEVKFRDDSGKRRQAEVFVRVDSLIPLARYLYRHSPEVRFYE